MSKRLEILKDKLAKQEAHVARMTEFDPKQRSIKAAVAIAEMYRERLAKLEGELAAELPISHLSEETQVAIGARRLETLGMTLDEQMDNLLSLED